MKNGIVPVLVLSVAVLAGCDKAREEQLERDNVTLGAKSDSLVRVINERDVYFEEVVRSINDVYSSLDVVREKEQRISREAGEAEGRFSLTNDQARARLLTEISGIDSALETSRRKINRLQARARSLNREFAGLNETIAKLKQIVEERETTIAMLEIRVSGLENEVIEQAKVIARRDSVIKAQEESLNRAFYVAGTRSELEEKGIIISEGGFPWGLFGSTTVVVNGVESSHFTPVDMTKENVITVAGTIDEIVPVRNQSYYTVRQVGENRTDLTVTDPAGFWQEKFLVIVVD